MQIFEANFAEMHKIISMQQVLLCTRKITLIDSAAESAEPVLSALLLLNAYGRGIT